MSRWWGISACHARRLGAEGVPGEARRGETHRLRWPGCRLRPGVGFGRGVVGLSTSRVESRGTMGCMTHSLAGRPENATQAKVLKLLRDEGPLSRVELADRLGVSRTTMASEVGRLTELGLAEPAGPAASRGGRRSTMVDLSADVRFVGIAIGATAMSVALTDGRLTVLGQRYVDMDVRQGPEHVLAHALELTRKVLAERGIERPSGVGIGVP